MIEILSRSREERSLTQLRQEAAFNLSTTYRIIHALKSRGYVEQNPINSKWKLSFKLFEIGNTVVQNVTLREEAPPILSKLANVPGESTYLMVLDQDEAVCLGRIDGHHMVKNIILQVGGRLPLHIGAGPKVLLSSLPEEEINRIIKSKRLPKMTKKTITDSNRFEKGIEKIGRNGYAFSFEDVVEDGAALGCPIKDWKGRVVGSISISGISTHLKRDKLPRLINIVKICARELSQRMKAPS